MIKIIQLVKSIDCFPSVVLSSIPTRLLLRKVKWEACLIVWLSKHILMIFIWIVLRKVALRAELVQFEWIKKSTTVFFFYFSLVYYFLTGAIFSIIGDDTFSYE